MRRLTGIILLIVGLAFKLSAQDQLNKMQLADNLFNRDEYFKSLPIYLELAKKSNPKLQVIERVADCYRLINDYENAEIWYKKVIAYPETKMANHFYYAEVLHRNMKFKEAREEYKIYAENENRDILAPKIAMIDSAEKWMQNPSPAYTIKNAVKFNSTSSDWGLGFLDDTSLVFTSDRKISQKKSEINKRNGDGYYKLYKTVVDTIAPLLLKINTTNLFKDSYHVGPMAVSPSGDTAYITVTTAVPKNKLYLDRSTAGTVQVLYTRRLQLVMAVKVNGIWSNFKNFVYNNVKEYSVGHAALSKDGNILYFTSDRPDGEGGTDIWYCTKTADGTWDEPANCGKLINTAGNECFPTISADGTSLYFSSNGLAGMGGLDIFKATGKQANWTKPFNLKFPLNSTSDDFYYCALSDNTGYISSNRQGGAGSDDIYSFNYHRANADILLPALAAKATVPPGKPMVTPGPQTTVIATVPSPQSSSALTGLKKGEGIILNNIYYDVNKANIRADAAEELDCLAEILKEHPTMRLEVSSHTDSRAPSNYNMALSKRRAQAVVTYLVRKGIAADRLVPVGYGDTRLLNKCEKGEYCTEDQHQINRRTEVHVLEE